MNKLRNLLYVAFAVFLIAVVVAVILVVIPHGSSGKMKEYENLNQGQSATVNVPEYVVDDEFRKKSVSDF